MASATMVLAGPTNNVAAKVQTVCPVEGGTVNHKLFVDYQGERIYFCCPGCPEVFNKDPAKYVKKLKDAGVTLEKTPEAAPKK